MSKVNAITKPPVPVEPELESINIELTPGQAATVMAAIGKLSFNEMRDAYRINSSKYPQGLIPESVSDIWFELRTTLKRFYY